MYRKVLPITDVAGLVGDAADRRSADRRRLLGLFAAVSAQVVLSACGGGGGDANPGPGGSPSAPAPAGGGGGTGSAAPTILGQPSGLFRAAPDRTSVQALTPFAITVDAGAAPYDYLAVVYFFSDTEFYVDYPIELSPGRLELMAPIGRVGTAGQVVYGPVATFVVRVRGDAEDISDVFSLDLTAPPTPALAAGDYASAVLAAAGQVRDGALRRSFGIVQGAGPTGYVPTELAALNAMLYSLPVAQALSPIADDTREEALLKLFMAALVQAIGVDLNAYIRQKPARASPHAFESDLLIDFEAFGRAVADKARADSQVIKRVGSLIGTIGAVGLAVGAGPLAGAAVGVGATMAAVGITFGLAEGFLWDNLGNLGEVGTTRALDIRKTALYWFDNVTGWALPQMTTSLLPSAADAPTRSRAGALLYEVARSEVLGRAKNAIVKAVDQVTNLDFASAFGTAVVEGVSNPWAVWASGGFQAAAFPLSSYRQTWSPPPAPPPPPPPPPGTGSCYWLRPGGPAGQC